MKQVNLDTVRKAIGILFERAMTMTGEHFYAAVKYDQRKSKTSVDKACREKELSDLIRQAMVAKGMAVILDALDDVEAHAHHLEEIDRLGDPFGNPANTMTECGGDQHQT